MQIIDLTTEHESLYFHCLEDWSEDIKEGADLKQRWYEAMKDKGLRVKLAQDDEGRLCGMIQYIPIEHTFAEGKDLYMILCIWVHGHKKGIGNVQKRGMGRALIHAAEEDVRSLGAKGIAAWGLTLPFWMKASWFKKYGFVRADKVSVQALMWKPFTDDAEPPKLIRPKKKPGKGDSKVDVTAFVNGWCPVMNMSYERAKRASAELGEKVEFRSIDTLDPEVREQWGITDAVYIDGKELNTGPPPKYEKVKKKIAKRVKRV